MVDFENKCITGVVRLVYPALDEKREYEGKSTWSVQVIVSKDELQTIDSLKLLAQQVAQAKFGNNVKMTAIKTPLRDGDLEDQGEAYENALFFSASEGRNKPGLVDADRNLILEQGHVKSGDWGRVSVNAYAWDHPSGGRGVSFGLKNVQWLRTGEPVGSSGTKAENDFDDGWEDTSEGRTSASAAW